MKPRYLKDKLSDGLIDLTSVSTTRLLQWSNEYMEEGDHESANICVHDFFHRGKRV